MNIKKIFSIHNLLLIKNISYNDFIIKIRNSQIINVFDKFDDIKYMLKGGAYYKYLKYKNKYDQIIEILNL